MQDSVAFGDLGVFEHRRCAGQVVEEADAVAEQHGDEIDADLVEQAEVEALLGDVGSRDADGLVTRAVAQPFSRNHGTDRLE